jgi:hypothetical protein
MLSEAQVELLGWIIESGTGEVIHAPIGNAPEDVVIVPGGPRQQIKPADFRQLVEQGLLRYASGKMYEVPREAHSHL